MKFSSAAKQADKMATALAKDLNDKLDSVGTIATYQAALKTAAAYMVERGEHLRDITPERAAEYLADRAAEVGQSQLDKDRQALQAVMHHINGNLDKNQTLDRIQSERETIQSSRAYTPEQIQAIADRQTDRNGLATEIAHAAGLRAHELATLARVEERPADVREFPKDDIRTAAQAHKFEGREGERYTVTGKGGLTREVVIPRELAERLEERRLEEPRTIEDRGIFYETRYEIGSGNAWSKSFSDASQKELEFSHGAHGARHSYAQERMTELRELGHDRETALAIVSQELGHFRPEITETYLR